MSDTDDFNQRNIAEFRANHGQVGDQFAGSPLLILHTVGARSGAQRVNLMMYLADDDHDRYLVFASKAGSDRNPDWYWNVLAHPDVRIEVGDNILDVHASELHDAERDAKWAEQAARYPGFGGYQTKTTRTIPVLALTPAGRTHAGVTS
jgi:deazaflavin-dependent oxidoreductase (nitroreductase family)